MSEFPWQNNILKDWSIVGMNHYHHLGQKFLFVAMSKDSVIIKYEGRDDQRVWETLTNLAEQQ